MLFISCLRSWAGGFFVEKKCLRNEWGPAGRAERETRYYHCRGRGHLHVFTPSLHKRYSTQVSPLLRHLQSQPHFTTLIMLCCIVLSPLCGWTWSYKGSSVSRLQRFQLLWLNTQDKHSEGFLAWLSFVPVTLPLSWRRYLLISPTHGTPAGNWIRQPDCCVSGKNRLMSSSREQAAVSQAALVLLSPGV